MSKLRRSMLFIPGNNPGMIQNADIFESDSVIFDLEDAVSPSEKDAARILVREAIKTLKFQKVEIVIRINSLETPLGLVDVEEIGVLPIDTILLPKAEANYVKLLDEKLLSIEQKNNKEIGCIKIIPLIETTFGLETISDIISSSKRIDGVLLGGEDLATDLEVKRTKSGEEIFYGRCRVSNICKAYKINAIDTPFTDINDMDGLKKDTEFSKSIGFTGKACINPRQIDVVHNVFKPTIEEIEKSQRIMNAVKDAEKKGLGVFSLDGKMIDAPIINRANKVLELSKMLNLI